MMRSYAKTAKEVVGASLVTSGGAMALHGMGSYGTPGLVALDKVSGFLPSYATLSLMKNTAEDIKWKSDKKLKI